MRAHVPGPVLVYELARPTALMPAHVCVCVRMSAPEGIWTRACSRVRSCACTCMPVPVHVGKNTQVCMTTCARHASARNSM
eukprot:7370061-Alexandrium_andersonii.AAC.1